jgi:hypothetical protein
MRVSEVVSCTINFEDAAATFAAGLFTDFTAPYRTGAFAGSGAISIIPINGIGTVLQFSFTGPAAPVAAFAITAKTSVTNNLQKFNQLQILVTHRQLDSIMCGVGQWPDYYCPYF